MKKILWVISGLAALALLVVFSIGTVDAKADGEHVHCVCGGTDTCLTTASTYGHEGDATKTSAISKTWDSVSSAAELKNKIVAAKTASQTEVCLYLAADEITVSETVVTLTNCGAGMRVYLCLNGKTLIAPGTSRLISTYSSTTGALTHISVSICDCRGGGVITGPDGNTGVTAQGGIALITNESYFYLYGGTIKDGKSGRNTSGSSRQGGNINVSGNSQMYMYGGTISHGTAGTYGGNIHANGATLTIYGGTISDGIAGSYGGNISLGGSTTVVIRGGMIQDGTAGSYGGNVCANSSTVTLDMYGGTIRHSTSTTSGGNVYNAGTFTIHGGMISEGAAGTYGGNLATEGTVILTGGTIQDGASTQYGGNVYITSKGTLRVESGTISRGTAATYGGNVHAGGTFQMTGGTIADGTANTSNGKEPGGNLFIAATGTISGGTLSGGTAYRGGNINVGGNGNLTISGSAKVIGGTGQSNGHSISVAGIMTVNGGYIVGQNTSDFAICTYTANNDVSGRTNGIKRIEVNGGVFDGTRSVIQTPAGGTVLITGGIFKKGIGAYKGNVIITGGVFLSTVTVGSSDGVGTGSLEITGGYFQNAPTNYNQQLVYGSFVETTDTAVAAGKQYYTRSDLTVNSVHSYYTYTEAESLAEFAEGTTYYEKNETLKSTAFNKSTAFTNYLGADETGTTTRVVIPIAAPIGKKMSLAENLNVIFEGAIDTSLPYLQNGTKVTFSLDGQDAVEAPATAAGAKTRYTFTGITPEYLGDTIVANFVSVGDNGTDYTLYSSTFTLKDYLNNISSTAEYAAYSPEKKAAMDALVNDLLVYGGQAQIKFNHNTSNLVSDGITGSGNEPTGNITDIYNKTTVTAQNYQDAAVIPGFFKEATAIHENVNWIRVKYTDNANDGNTTFTIQKGDGTEEAITLDSGYLCTEGLMPTEYGTKITFRAYRGAELLSKVEYSMNSYCVRKHSDTGHEFSDALYNYGASAAAYAAAN